MIYSIDVKEGHEVLPVSIPVSIASDFKQLPDDDKEILTDIMRAVVSHYIGNKGDIRSSLSVLLT